MKKILITGGFGYIGAHLVKLLAEADDYEIHVVDRDIGSPNRPFVLERAFNAEVKDLRDAAYVGGAYDAVVHLAADISVEESTKDPLKYWNNNVGALTALLSRVETANLIYASTGTAGHPNNAYAYSKLAGEHLVRTAVEAHPQRIAGRSIFRFFNVSGLDVGIKPTGQPTHLIRIAAEVARGQRRFLTVYGTNYETDDGTAVRDYVHVNDVVDSLKLAIDNGPQACQGIHVGDQDRPLELGTQAGVSVLTVIKTMQEVSGHPIPVVFGDRRPGDVARLVCNNRWGKFTQNRTLGDMCESAFRNLS